MSRAGWAVLLGGGLLGGTLFFALSGPKQKAESADPEPEPAERPPQNTGIVPPDRGGSPVPTEQTQEALAQQWAQKDPVAFNRSIELYKTAYGVWLAERKAASAQNATWTTESQKILTQVGKVDPAFDSVAKVPIVGQVVAGIYQIIRRFAVANAEAKRDGYDTAFFRANIRAGGLPEFTGYRDGVFWLRDMPVSAWGYQAWDKELGEWGKGIGESYLAALQALAVYLPIGYQVPMVTVQPDGSFFYTFNKSGNGDLSSAARDLRQVFGLEVWNPADITPTGPRGFNPLAPRAWIAVGQKSNVLDLPGYTPPPLPVAPAIDPSAPLGSPTNPYRNAL